MAEFSMVWRGDQVLDEILTAATDAMGPLATQAEAEMRVGAPVRTGFLRDSVYAFVDVSGGVGSRTPAVIMGASAAYASFVILGTRFMAGRDFVTPAALALGRAIAPAITDALAAKGYANDGGAPRNASGQFAPRLSGGAGGPGQANPFTSGPLTGLLPAALREAPLNP
jgi:hypothetical protein